MNDPHDEASGIRLSPALEGVPEDERTLLIVDDDAPLCQRLARAMERRGFVVATADSIATGVRAAAAAPAFAVVDLRLNDGSGLDVVKALRKARPGARIVMLTGYGNIATAVAAVKAGAVDYMPKPVDADAVERALLSPADGSLPPPPEDPMSADRVRWEHIQRVFEQCDRNVSETARRLKMHRRTLQRILGKHAPRS
jgi:two-component system, response regulator RegA